MKHPSYRIMALRHSKMIIWIIGALMLTTASKAQDKSHITKDYIGIWANRCKNPNDAVIKIDTNHVTVEIHGDRYVYSGIDFSYTYGEGAHASGRNSWILVSRVPNGPYAFVLTVPGFGRTGPIVFENGAESEGREVRDLSGVRFRRCRQ